MEFKYVHLSVVVHFIIGFVFLAEFLKPRLPINIYNYLKDKKDTLLGMYYVYIAFELYTNIHIISSPRSSIYE